MLEIKTLPDFDLWLGRLQDKPTQRRLVVRLRKASLGLMGDVKEVGNDVMLGGGEKSTQATDIQKSIALASQLEE